MTGIVMISKGGGCTGGTKKGSSQDEQNQLSMIAILAAAIRKSLVACRFEDNEDVISGMDIGWPTNVQHITHVTFDRFHGFLGLPVEFEVEIPCRVPSASVTVFGVSAESMQCSYDSKGNSVPTILLLMQERLYSQEGLKAEGIFRINPENGQEEHVRDQLNRGIVPKDIDVHCLAGLIKAWFRELPSGVLDGLSPEQVLQCNTEEECVELVGQLKPTDAALLNWAIDLMADVVQEEDSNKMNARNIAMVFAPNMTQMSDPLTALMHAVQVMNLLKSLITKTLREREESTTGGYSPMSSHSYGQQSDDDFDSQREMDTSCELRQGPSDYDDGNTRYNPTSEEEEEEDDDGEVESLGEIENCFLSQLDKTTDNILFEKTPGNLPAECESSRTFSGYKLESPICCTDSKNENSSSVTSDGEDSRSASTDRRISSRRYESCEDVEMVDKLAESNLPMHHFSSEAA
ncbi:Rho GTPase-activating protein 2 [Euphorbia peplus]|nr:Rho GTPase-activating protein 2 [Euphorbia peplus]